jgi:hypothetical protein
MSYSNSVKRRSAAVAIAALVAATAVAAAVKAPKRRVILYGDSLALEARDYFALSIQSGDEAVVVDRTFGGTAICDWLDRMRRDVRDLQPTAVVLEFVGNNVTPCMRGPDGPLTGGALVQKYDDDARIATAIFAGVGVRVYWMGGPRISGLREIEFTGIRDVYEAEPTRLTFATPPLDRVRYSDAGRSLLEDGHYTTTLPCAPSEGAAQGCVDQRIAVRGPDGLHLCPVELDREANGCPVYSGGAARFGFAMAEPVRRDLDL